MKLDERVQADLAAATRFRDLRLVAETGSTNRDVMALAGEGALEGLVVVADHQSAGRGRLDRSWEAGPGEALLVSVLLRPQGLPVGRRHLVTAAAALAAQSACATLAGVEPEIKWPNDLLAGPGKLAGILAQSSGEVVVAGMGLNVHAGPPGAAVLDHLAGRRVRREDLLVAWLHRLEDLLAGGWDAVAEGYRRRCATIGRPVRVELARGEVLEGRATSVDADGRLVVRGRDGAATPVAAGDVTHLR